MLKIDLSHGHYKSVKDGTVVVLSSRHFIDGATMYELFLGKKNSPETNVYSVIQHFGLDRSFSAPNYGKVVQRFGEGIHQEMRVKTIVVKDLSPTKMKEVNFEIIIKEYKHPAVSGDSVTTCSDRHLLYSSKYLLSEDDDDDDGLTYLYSTIINHSTNVSIHNKYVQFSKEKTEVKGDRQPSRSQVRYGRLHVKETNPEIVIKVRKYESDRPQKEGIAIGIIDSIISTIVRIKEEGGDEERNKEEEEERLLTQDDPIFSNFEDSGRLCSEDDHYFNQMENVEEICEFDDHYFENIDC